MSSRVGVPAIYDTSPVSSNVRRGAPVHRRAQSESGVRSGPAVSFGRGMGFAFGRTSDIPGPPSFVGSYGPRVPTTTRNSARDADELYENYFIGSTKIPKNQNQIVDPAEVSRIEKQDAKIEKESELVSAIKKALGKSKGKKIYKNNVENRQYSGVLQERANSLNPKNFWSTNEVNAYRMRKM